MIFHSRPIAIVLLIDMVALLMYNFSGMCVTGGPCLRLACAALTPFYFPLCYILQSCHRGLCGLWLCELYLAVSYIICFHTVVASTSFFCSVPCLYILGTLRILSPAAVACSSCPRQQTVQKVFMASWPCLSSIGNSHIEDTTAVCVIMEVLPYNIGSHMCVDPDWLLWTICIIHMSAWHRYRCVGCRVSNRARNNQDSVCLAAGLAAVVHTPWLWHFGGVMEQILLDPSSWVSPPAAQFMLQGDN